MNGTTTLPHAPPGTSPARTRAVGVWLIACAALVYAMVVVGGVTRLTGSGLSMVRWHPVSGVLPPVGADAWQREFDAYRASPEYRLVNRGMTLAEFRRIFWMEYAHRMLGRGVGIAFLVPFLVFLAMRAIPRGMAPRLAGVFVLGGVQGVLGWYMVRSGLVDEPRVSQYRLAAHLSLAVVIYVYLLALALRLLGPRDPDGAAAARSGSVEWLALASGVSVFATLVTGAFVAGLKAGYLHPTFPTMSGYWVPPGMFEAAPWWRNFFENPVTAQFTHRVLAFASCAAVVAAWVASLGAGVSRGVRLWAHASFATAAVQVGLGISTLLLHVPIPLAAGHQAGAIALLTCLVGLYLGTRAPRLAPASSAGRG
ncbi:MAG: COX15/CtaA family protein [Chromatiales bacterium]|nr:COX15/CtaA family protein [Chromatiales bacterium]